MISQLDTAMAAGNLGLLCRLHELYALTLMLAPQTNDLTFY